VSYCYRSCLFYYFTQVRCFWVLVIVSPVLLFGGVFEEFFYVLFYFVLVLVGWVTCAVCDSVYLCKLSKSFIVFFLVNCV
jgi:hypothetical protein